MDSQQALFCHSKIASIPMAEPEAAIMAEADSRKRSAAEVRNDAGAHIPAVTDYRTLLARTPSTPRSCAPPDMPPPHLADGAEADAGGDDPAAKKLKAADDSAAPVTDAAAPDGNGAASAAEPAAADADAAATDPEPAGVAVDDAGEAAAQDAAMDAGQAEAAEDGAAADAPDEEGGGDGGGGDANGEVPEAEPQGERAEEKPVTLGYRTFASGKECFDYFHKLLSKLTPNQDLNEVLNLRHTGALLWSGLISTTHDPSMVVRG